MLDLIFYPAKDDTPHYIELSEDFYEWLAKSEFSKIGESVSTTMTIDGEKEELPLVELEADNRSRFRHFLKESRF